MHCTAGINRSAAIVVHYVMRQCRYDLQTAHDSVKQHKPNILLSSGFLSQLANREATLYGRRIFDFGVYQAKLIQSLTPSQARAAAELRAITNRSSHPSLSSVTGKGGKSWSSLPVTVLVQVVISFVIATVWMLKALRVL